MEYLSILTKDGKVLTGRERFAASLSRIWQHATQGDYPVGMVTAFRGPVVKEINGEKVEVPRHTRNENLKRNLNLAQDLKNAGLSWITTKGGYVEGYGTPHAVEVEEDSFFVIAVNKDKKVFEEILYNLGKKYNQDSIALIDSTSKQAYLLGTQEVNEEGEETYPGDKVESPIGLFHPNKIGEFYSRWKRKKFEFRATSVIDSLLSDPKQMAIFNHCLKQEKKT